MRLIDIIKELNLRSGADIDEDVWVMYINSALRTFGRYIGRMTEATIFKGMEDNSGWIHLPEAIKSESIVNVDADGKRLVPAEIGENRDGTYATYLPEGIRINAGDWETGHIYHTSVKKCDGRDAFDREGDFEGQDMNIDEEYVNAVIFGALAEYNEVNEEIEAANNYRNKADEIVARAMQGRYIKRGKYPVTKDVMRWN